jgi:type II secretory pathway component PulF
VVVPRYERMIREHGLKLTASTQMLLDLSLWANAYPLFAGLLTLGLMAAGAALAYVAQSGGISRNARLLLLVAVFVVPCGLFVLTWVGVQGTHRTLVEGLKK